MATAHIAAEPGDFAPDVLMPGDPLRARRMADLLLEDAKLVTEVRGMFGFTGLHQGRPLSVMASGMGMPSATIYATELVRFFGVRRIVRVGTAGALSLDVDVRDVVVATSAHTDSAMTAARIPGITFSHAPAFDLAARAVSGGRLVIHGPRVHAGPVFSSDHFYLERPEVTPALTAHGTLAVEMEAAGLYAVAAAEKCQALAVLTISDHLLTGQQLSSAEREESFQGALAVALAALAD
jgi:purine-nucleoside phosphorylase